MMAVNKMKPSLFWIIYFTISFLFVIGIGIVIWLLGFPEGCTSGYCPF